MPAKKKSKSKASKSKSKSKSKTIKKRTVPRKSASKARSSRKSLKLLKKRTAAPKKATKRRVRTKSASVSTARELEQDIRNRRVNAASAPETRQSDFRGLSREEEADSESVDELVEEGNIFEAGAVAGVEEADNSDEREVHTHEVPEDDVPDEYLEKD